MNKPKNKLTIAGIYLYKTPFLVSSLFLFSSSLIFAFSSLRTIKCHNSLRIRNIIKDEIPFEAGYVPEVGAEGCDTIAQLVFPLLLYYLLYLKIQYSSGG